MSDDGSVVVFTRISNGPLGLAVSLMTRNLLTGVETPLYNSDLKSRRPVVLGITNDGQEVLYGVWDGQPSGPVYLANTAAGTSTQISLDVGEQATGGTLSGSGNATYVTTSHGRIVKVLLRGAAPGPSYTVVPKTPYVSKSVTVSLYSPYPPGSMVRLQGVLPDSVDQLSGHILLDGSALPVLAASPTEVRVQIPWEQKTGYAGLMLSVPTESPFHQNDLVFVDPFAPSVEGADPGQRGLLGLKIIKSDFSASLTTPPGPGEIINMYFTGLGPVSGPVHTGVPAPADRLLPITGQLTCEFSPKQSPMETLFAGLAPLLTGIYQVSFRMSADAGGDPISGLQCSLTGPYGSSGFSTFQTTAQP